jgi:cyclohexanone monooxygenase/acetone monooxygenase
MTSTPTPTEQLDAVILGAGVAGLYQLHQLREQGLRVRAIDKAGDVGGTWWWNRYPGARFDSEAYIYQYYFDEQKDCSWSEKFPGQVEVEQWLHYVTDRLDLRKDIQFSTTITSAHFDEDRGRWTVTTDRGDVIDAQFFVSCAGMLSAPMEHPFEAQDSFRGPILHTSKWPAGGIDLAGKRVGVVGTGATGIQVIQTIADQVGHLTVFARTPQYTLPMKSALRPGGAGGLQGAFRRAQGDDPAHVQRLRVRMGARLGRLHPREAPRKSSRRSTRTARSSCGARGSARCSSPRRSARRSPSSSAARCATG